MAPVKQMPSLSSLSKNVVTDGLTAVFKKLSIKEADKIDELKKYYDVLPVTVSDGVIEELIGCRARHRDSDTMIVFTLKILSNERTQIIKIDHDHYIGEHCDDQWKNIFGNIVRGCLAKATDLRELTLIMCNDEYLEVIGRNLRNLKELVIGENFVYSMDLNR